jgi:hypothetical protein
VSRRRRRVPAAAVDSDRCRACRILTNPQIDAAKQESLKHNAVDVKIVFEDNRSDSHQDFADCGKAKSIAKSLITTFDVRDERNKRSRELVAKTPFLKAYVDATASNVNLSAKSRKIWSMSAVRMFIAHIAEHHPNKDSSVEQKTQGVEEFFAALAKHLPQLAALDKVKNDKEPEVTAGQFREKRGGARGLAQYRKCDRGRVCRIQPDLHPDGGTR